MTTPEEFKLIQLLSPTEYIIFNLAAKGTSSINISRFQLCSIKTVEAHFANMRKKLQIERGVGVYALAGRYSMWKELQRIERVPGVKYSFTFKELSSPVKIL
jgi:DNA-binding CsgD family transcriptional regulator